MNISPSSISMAVKPYLYLKAGELGIRCPYWMNRMKGGVVIMRGYLDGKGKAREIEVKLAELASKENIHNNEELLKLAMRNRIGIDCSGLAYRIFEEVTHGQAGRLFPGGITKTNVLRMVAPGISEHVKSIGEIKPGDMITLMGRKHVLIVEDHDGREIKYFHSSRINTVVKGVHSSKIIISAIGSGLEKQEWTEETVDGRPYGLFFKINEGDGIFRLNL